MRLRKKPWMAKALAEYLGKEIIAEDIDKNKGKWQELVGGKSLALEIGCGKGKFINGMAQLYPEMGFVGIETQLDICYYPARQVRENKLTNVKIIGGDAAYLTQWFLPGEVQMIYLNFSDPWPKARHSKRRLTYRDFLLQYKTILAPGGHLRFKTDNKDLFDFSVEEFKAFGLQIIALSYDLHNSEYENAIQTEYEEKFSAKGNKINFCEVVF